MSKTHRAERTERKPQQQTEWLWTAADRRIAARIDDSEQMTASDYSAALQRASESL